MKNWLPVLVAVSIVASAAVAQRVTVDQGRPGAYGPWPVIGGTGGVAIVGADGGVSISTTPGYCTAIVHTSTAVGVASTNTPAAQQAGRRYITICNSLQNTSTPSVKCRVDGTAPVMAATNAGDVLGVGDCILYPVSATVIPKCIADAAATNVTTFECK